MAQQTYEWHVKIYEWQLVLNMSDSQAIDLTYEWGSPKTQRM